MRYTGPKVRLCRREGVNLFGPEKYLKIMQRRNSTPGAASSVRKKDVSGFAKQLREKQKAKRMYGVTEKQFRRYFQKAVNSKGVTGDRLLQLLELRLDNVVFRSGFAVTRPQARQFTSHRQFLLNGRLVDVPSISVRPGDVISVRDRFENNLVFTDLPGRLKFIPRWLQIDSKKKTITVLRLPEGDEFDALISAYLIVEFYSR
jgi:small subunit ribosomal protein S4